MGAPNCPAQLKDIGWVLRELSTRELELAKELVLRLGARASDLSLREATGRMPPEVRARVLAALGRPAK